MDSLDMHCPLTISLPQLTMQGLTVKALLTNCSCIRCDLSIVSYNPLSSSSVCELTNHSWYPSKPHSCKNTMWVIFNHLERKTIFKMPCFHQHYFKVKKYTSSICFQNRWISFMHHINCYLIMCCPGVPQLFPNLSPFFPKCVQFIF